MMVLPPFVLSPAGGVLASLQACALSVTWHPLFPVAAFRFSVSTPSTYLARVSALAAAAAAAAAAAVYTWGRL